MGLVSSLLGPCIYGVLYYRQPVRPVVLLVVAVDSKCCFDVLIGFLRLSVRLWVIGSAEVLRNLQLFAQLPEERRSETRVSVRDDFLWEPHEWKDAIFEQFGHPFCVNRFLAWHQDDRLSAIMIGDRHDRIIAF